MSTTYSSDPQRPGARAQAAVEEDGRAWTTFAGVMLMMLGVINIIYGIAAIDSANFYISDAHYVISDLNTWGWVAAILGGAQIVSAFSIWAGGQVGRWFAVGCVALNGIAQLLAIPGYPFLAITLFGLDILVLYALIAHGGRGGAGR